MRRPIATVAKAAMDQACPSLLFHSSDEIVVTGYLPEVIYSLL
jgi:hypothetical protein